MKLYVLVRADLRPGLQMAQAIHATRQFAEEYPEIEKNWFFKSNTIVCLNVDNQQSLLGYCELALRNGLKFSIFREPDLNNEITSIVLQPSLRSREICKDLPLALK